MAAKSSKTSWHLERHSQQAGYTVQMWENFFSIWIFICQFPGTRDHCGQQRYLHRVQHTGSWIGWWWTLRSVAGWMTSSPAARNRPNLLQSGQCCWVGCCRGMCTLHSPLQLVPALAPRSWAYSVSCQIRTNDLNSEEVVKSLILDSVSARSHVIMGFHVGDARLGGVRIFDARVKIQHDAQWSVLTQASIFWCARHQRENPYFRDPTSPWAHNASKEEIWQWFSPVYRFMHLNTTRATTAPLVMRRRGTPTPMPIQTGAKSVQETRGVWKKNVGTCE